MKKLNFFSTKKSTQFFLTLFFCITLIFSVLTGCDDKDSSEAKLFDAEEALDDGDWAKARAILETLGTSEIVLQYLSNCSTGELGINTFDLLTTMADDMANENGSIDMIGELIGNDDNVLSCDEIIVKFSTINDAIDNINLISTLSGTDLNSDQTVQLGIASMTRTVFIIAKLICEQTRGDTEIELTEIWIDANSVDFLPFVESAEWTSTYSAMLNEDITNIVNAAAAMSGDNDIKEDLNAFIAEIDNGENGGADNDGLITIGELNYYLDAM